MICIIVFGSRLALARPRPPKAHICEETTTDPARPLGYALRKSA